MRGRGTTMNKLFLSVVATAMLSGPMAFAADMPVKAKPPKW